MFTSDGGMCEHLIAPEQLLVKSSTLSFDELALVETLGIRLFTAAN
ncbi:MAG: hypothetical protein M1298_03650 [Chloroflexi bacterium]|nr:hypothetical protein [Chloroflexota bacterium]